MRIISFITNLKVSMVFLVVAALIPISWASANMSRLEARSLEEGNPRQARKINKLVDYLQAQFSVSEDKAVAIVKEAFRKGIEHDLHPELILAIIAVESTFRAKVISHAGARGLMQIMPTAHPEKVAAIGGVSALFDPIKNISTGSQILVDYLELSSGDLRQALLRYNGSLSNPSSGYPDKVLDHYQKMVEVSGRLS